MLTFKEFLNESEKEVEREEEVGDSNEDIELDLFQEELLDILSKKYPKEAAEDLTAVILDITKKIYSKFEPKDKE